VNSGGLTALMGAAAAGQMEALEALLAHSADVNRRGANDRTALVWAATYGQETAARRLADAGADVNLPFDDDEPWEPGRKLRIRYTPLGAAIMSGNASLVRLLLERGADPNARDGL